MKTRLTQFLIGAISIPITGVILSLVITRIYDLLGLYDSVKRDPLIAGPILSFIFWFLSIYFYRRHKNNVDALSYAVWFTVGGFIGSAALLGLILYAISNITIPL